VRKSLIITISDVPSTRMDPEGKDIWEGQDGDYSRTRLLEQDGDSDEGIQDDSAPSTRDQPPPKIVEYDSAEEFEDSKPLGSKRSMMVSSFFENGTGNRSKSLPDLRKLSPLKCLGGKKPKSHQSRKKSKRTINKMINSQARTRSIMAEEPEGSIFAEKCKKCKARNYSLQDCRIKSDHKEVIWSSHEYVQAKEPNSWNKRANRFGTGTCVPTCSACDTDANGGMSSIAITSSTPSSQGHLELNYRLALYSSKLRKKSSWRLVLRCSRWTLMLQPPLTRLIYPSAMVMLVTMMKKTTLTSG
jgi:hypothetical protein